MSLNQPLRWLPNQTKHLLSRAQRPAFRNFSSTITNTQSKLGSRILSRTSPFSTASASTSTSRSQFQSQLNRRFNFRFQQKRANSSNQSSSGSSSSSGAGAGAGAGSSAKEPTGLSARLKKLTREYGWAALGVYLTLSALDFPFCFAAVRLLGVDRIGHFEHVILGYLKGVFGSVWPGSSTSGEEGKADKQEQVEGEGEEKAVEGGEILGADGIAKKEKAEEASIWTQLVFAYAIHKSLLIFVRVPLTAAVTPKVVKVLRRWGWDIGKRKPKST